MLPFCGFSVGNWLLCGALAASTGALWRTFCREWSEFLGVVGYVGYGVGGGRVLPLPLVMDLVIFGSREKKKHKGSKVRLMLLPLITKGLLCKAPIKSTTVNTVGCC